MAEDGNLRSKECTTPAHVRFTNRTERIVDIFWANFQGILIPYRRLQPGEKYDISTFTTHPWIFIDPRTGERMQTQNNDVFFPKPYFMINPTTKALVKARREILIQFPLRTLRDAAKWTIVKEIQSDSDLCELGLPRTLKDELQGTFKVYSKHRLTFVNRQWQIQQ